MKLKSFMVLLALIATPAAAQDAVEEKAAPCSACHGGDGVPTQPDTPLIWGQHAEYLRNQLTDYKSRRRKHDVMNAMVAALEEEDLQALAEYFSKKPWPRIPFAASEADRKAADAMASSGLCAQCHLIGFAGGGATPRISGQNALYLENTLLDFKSRKRRSNPAKSSLLSAYSKDDIKAMARYLAGLAPE